MYGMLVSGEGFAKSDSLVRRAIASVTTSAERKTFGHPSARHARYSIRVS